MRQGNSGLRLKSPFGAIGFAVAVGLFLGSALQAVESPEEMQYFRDRQAQYATDFELRVKTAEDKKYLAFQQIHRTKAFKGFKDRSSPKDAHQGYILSSNYRSEIQAAVLTSRLDFAQGEECVEIQNRTVVSTFAQQGFQIDADYCLVCLKGPASRALIINPNAERIALSLGPSSPTYQQPKFNPGVGGERWGTRFYRSFPILHTENLAHLECVHYLPTGSRGVGVSDSDFERGFESFFEFTGLAPKVVGP